MKKVRNLLFLVSTIFCFKNGASQLYNGAIFYLNGGSVLIGSLVSDHGTPFRVKIETGDTISMFSDVIKKQYLPEDVSVHGKGKYNYKKGFGLNLETGGGDNLIGSNALLSYLLHGKYEFGIGIGAQSAFVDLPTANLNQRLQAQSVNYFLHGRYFIFPDMLRRPYVKATLGYASFGSVEGESIQTGYLLEGGFGYMFSSKTTSKWYLEIGQQALKVKGSVPSFDPNALSDIQFNLLLSRVYFRVGIFVGR